MTLPDAELMRIFDFTADDLAANRDGTLSQQQALYLHKLINREILFYLIPIGAVLIIGWFIAIKLADVAPPTYDKPSIILVFGVIPTAIFLTMLAYRKWQIVSDTRGMHVEVTQGVTKSWAVKNFGYAEVNGKRFYLGLKIDRQLADYLRTLPKESQFRVYFVPRSKRVISMEPVTE